MRRHWIIYAVIYTFYLSTLAFAEVRKVTQEDIALGAATATETSLGGHVGKKIPRFWDNNAFTDNLTLYGNDLIVKSPWVDVRAYSTLSLALTAASGKTLLVASEVAVSADTTIDNTVHVMVLRGGSFNIATGKTLTISGPFSAGIYKVFTCNGTGNVAWTGTPVVEVNVEWFTGNVGYSFLSTAKTTELQKAFDSLPTVGGNIKFNTLVPIDNTITTSKYGLHVSGIAVAYSYTRGTGIYNAGVDTPALKFTNPNAIYIDYLTVVGTKGHADSAGNAHGIWFAPTSSAGLVHVNNSFVSYNKGDGIKFTGAIYGGLFVTGSMIGHNGNGINAYDVAYTGNALTIQNNQISENDNNAILWGNAIVLNILNNTMEVNHPTPTDNVTGHSIYINGSGTSINIVGNYFEDYGANHIEFFADAGKTIKGIEIRGNSFIVGTGLIDEDHAMVKFSGTGTISGLNYDVSNVGPTYLFDGGNILDSSCVVPFGISAPTGDTFSGGYYWKNWGSAKTSTFFSSTAASKTMACVRGTTWADNTYTYKCVTSGNIRRTASDNTW